MDEDDEPYIGAIALKCFHAQEGEYRFATAGNDTGNTFVASKPALQGCGLPFARLGLQCPAYRF
jgi:hypothetical protein